MRQLEQLLEDVYDRPDDDAARLVFADALLADGRSSWGEFINLQYVENPSAEQLERMEQLRKAHWKGWIRDLHEVTNHRGVEFRNGFPWRVRVLRQKRYDVNRVPTYRAWRTVVEVQIEELARDFDCTSEVFGRVVLWCGLVPARLAELVSAGTTARSIEARLNIEAVPSVVQASTQRVPHLRQLSLDTYYNQRLEARMLDELLGCPIMAPLEELSYGTVTPDEVGRVARGVEDCPQLRTLVVMVRQSHPWVSATLRYQRSAGHWVSLHVSSGGYGFRFTADQRPIVLAMIDNGPTVPHVVFDPRTGMS